MKRFIRIISTILFIIVCILFTNVSNAATYNQEILEADSYTKNGIDLFPKSYQVELNKLVDKTGHSNWKFRPFYTDIDWNELTSPTNENKCLRNTIIEKRTYYNIKYRVHVQDIGWMPWVQNGQTAGTTGQSKRIEAIQIKIEPQDKLNLKYNTYVQDIGWMPEVTNGTIAGIERQSKRVEAIKINLNPTFNTNIKYRVHVQDIGWMPWVTNGSVAGTEGQSKQVEAIQIKLTNPTEWFCSCGKFGDPGYICASGPIVNYYLDPRNFLTEKTIFQFLDLSNTTVVSLNEIQNAVNGTYLAGNVNGESYSSMIYDAARESGEGAFSIIVRIFQELGKGTSLPYMISGNDPDYPEVYNFFNYGATDGTGNLKRGLEYAKNAGWTTPRKALIEGAKLVAGTYTKAGQLNKYLYKFDVAGSEYNQLYCHQYMTNIQDPNSQALQLHTTYNNSGLINKNITFVIPIYKNMPTYTKLPNHENPNANLYYVDSNYSSVAFRDTNGNKKTDLYKDTVVTMLQQNAKNINGNLSGKISVNGEEGYMAMQYLTPVNNIHDVYKVPKQKYLGNNKNPYDMISYTAQLQDIGWIGWVANGEPIGMINSNKRLETIKISLTEQLKCEELQYRVHVQDIGWMDWVGEGQEAGTVGQSKQIEAVQIKMKDLGAYDIFYRVCIEGRHWTDWVSNGKIAGSTGQSKKITAIAIKIQEASPINNRGLQYKGTVNIDNTAYINYDTHLQDIGWMGWRTNNQIAGSTGQRRKMEAIKIQLSDTIMNEGIELTYRVHVQDIGWMDWKKNGEIAGITNQSKRVEAIQIKLKNGENYDFQYRVHVQDIGWMDWKNNGEIAGTTGRYKRIEAIQIKLVPKDIGGNISVIYNTHVQDIGWMDEVQNGEIIGTTSQPKRIEAIKINLKDPKGLIENGIQYKVHVQDIGWMNWVSDGEIAGTTGQSKRVEAIQIKLKNQPNRNISYRVHVQDIGWMNWVSDGEIAGTTGQSKRVEAIQIKIEQ